MNDYEKKVAQFHNAFGQTVGEPVTPELLALRKDLIAEEVRELFEEIDKSIALLRQNQIVPKEIYLNMLKEMADVQYVLSGMAVTFGMPLQKVFDRVHETNMSKLGRDGKPLMRADGKILKGPDYHPPTLDDLIP